MSTAWGERLQTLHEARKLLYSLPCDVLFELPGRPNVMYSIKDYTADKTQGAQECRSDMPFLFKAFETGQIGPRRLSRMVGENKPRNATIHEYLDWTVTGVEAKNEGEYDFSGFRLLVLLPRERVMWPAPGQYDKPEKKKHPDLGAPLDPLPQLMVKGKPLSAATIRTGPDYIEVPFVATHENKRGRGFGRCVVEAIEDVARALNIPRLLLCSTCEASVSNTWKHLGFQETNEQQLASWDVEDSDLVHMQNTLQMHKAVPPPRSWRPLRIRHQAFVARVYVSADKQSLSSKSCVQRPGMHDMGAISGFRSSRANSTITTASVSNASYGTAEQSQQQEDEAGSRLAEVQKGVRLPALPAPAAAAEQQANGATHQQQQDHQQDHHHHQQQQQHTSLLPEQQQLDTAQQQQPQSPQLPQQQPEQQQQVDAMLIDAPPAVGLQQEALFIGQIDPIPAADADAGAELLASALPTAAPMETS